MTLITFTDQPVTLDNGIEGEPLSVTTANPCAHIGCADDQADWFNTGMMAFWGNTLFS